MKKLNSKFLKSARSGYYSIHTYNSIHNYQNFSNAVRVGYWIARKEQPKKSNRSIKRFKKTLYYG